MTADIKKTSIARDDLAKIVVVRRKHCGSCLKGVYLSMSVSQEIVLNVNSEIIPECQSLNESGTSTTTPTQKKSKKVRKEQSEEEYTQQKKQFYHAGPTINTEDWLYDSVGSGQLDNSKKTDRVKMLHACEKAYYQRDYRKCLELIDIAESLFEVKLDNDDDNTDIKTGFEASGKKTKKSAKVERHVIDLLHIKERCLYALSN